MRGQATVILAAILPKLADMYDHMELREQAIALCEESLALLCEMEPSIRRDRVGIDVKTRLGWLLRGRQHARGARLLREALALADQLGDLWRKEYGLWLLANHAPGWSETEGILRQAIAVADETGEQWCKAACLDMLYWILRHRGQYQGAERMAAEGLRLREELGDRSWIGFSLAHVGEAAVILGKFELAEQYFLRGIAIADEVNYARVKIEILRGQGRLALSLGQYAEAKECFNKCVLLSRESPHAGSAIEALAGLGHSAYALGEIDQAREYYHQSLEEALRTGRQASTQEALVGLAALLAHEGQSERGVELLALVVEHPTTYQVDRDRARELLNELESGMHPEQFAAAMERGQARNLEEVVAEMLEGR